MASWDLKASGSAGPSDTKVAQPKVAQPKVAQPRVKALAKVKAESTESRVRGMPFGRSWTFANP